MLTQMFANVNTQNQEPAIREEALPVGTKVSHARYSGDASIWKVANQILAGTMNEAVSALGGVGVKLLIPETNFASCESVAAYFGVTPQYLQGLAYRIGLRTNKLPDDVRSNEGMTFLVKHGIQKDYVHDGVFFKHKDGMYKIRKASEMYFSARAILVLVSAMEHAKPYNRTVMNGNVSVVYDNVRNSIYGERARQEEAMNKQTPGKDTAILDKDGNLVLTLDFFSAIIKTTVREAVSEAVNKTTAQENSIMEVLPCLVEAHDNGIICADQAAKILNVSKGTYYKLKSKFKNGN